MKVPLEDAARKRAQEIFCVEPSRVTPEMMRAALQLELDARHGKGNHKEISLNGGDRAGAGWFYIPDVQSGFRPLSTQLEMLQPIIDHCEGKSVLDLGCAEGLIAAEFAKFGASMVHGLELVKSRVRKGKQLTGHLRNLSLKIADVSDFGKVHGPYPGLSLRMNYDITLALAIAHKLPHPEQFLRQTAGITKEVYVLKIPDPVIQDPRSGNRRISPLEILEEEFEPINSGRNSIGEYILIMRRRQPSANSKTEGADPR